MFPSRLFKAGILTACSLVASGCGGGESETTQTASAPSADGIVVDTYVVRGRVVSLPDPANPSSQLMIHHEEIPDFRGQGGERGMNEMTMPFPIGESLNLSGIEAGQAVRVTFTVDYNETEDKLVTYRATSIEALPEGAPTGLVSDQQD